MITGTAITSMARIRLPSSTCFRTSSLIRFKSSSQKDSCAEHAQETGSTGRPLYSLTAPILIPFTKYFCRKGYRTMKGRIAVITQAFLIVFTVAPQIDSGRSEDCIISRSFIWKL